MRNSENEFVLQKKKFRWLISYIKLSYLVEVGEEVGVVYSLIQLLLNKIQVRFTGNSLFHSVKFTYNLHTHRNRLHYPNHRNRNLPVLLIEQNQLDISTVRPYR